MAINIWITAQVDPGANSKADRADDVHIMKRNTAPANDFTLSFDSAKVVQKATLRSLMDQAFRIVDGGGELT